jgi:hypothetical protein
LAAAPAAARPSMRTHLGGDSARRLASQRGSPRTRTGSPGRSGRGGGGGGGGGAGARPFKKTLSHQDTISDLSLSGLGLDELADEELAPATSGLFKKTMAHKKTAANLAQMVSGSSYGSYGDGQRAMSEEAPAPGKPTSSGNPVV